MPAPLRLSVLDVSPVPDGSTAGEALANTTDLARHAEALGYTRYWLAEHHGSVSLACSSPEILIGHVAAATSRIRVGSGGVMLPNHSPLQVAERFKVLEALHPGRIDLGIGRAPGTDGRTALALRRSRQALGADDFGEQLSELIGFLHDDLPEDHPFASVLAAPAGVDAPGMWLLGSSGYAAAAAGQLGFGFAHAHHIAPEPAVESLRAYRAAFRPSAVRSVPEAALAVSVVCGETDDAAAVLASSVQLMMTRLVSGDVRRPIPTVAEALAHDYTPGELAMQASLAGRQIVGGPDTVRAAITELADRSGATEVIVTTIVHDHAARRRSYELLAGAFHLAPLAAGAY